MTDLCYMACVKRLLAARENVFPQFATHNALTVGSVIEAAGGVEGFEFQRLYGMGEALYAALLADLPGATCRVYAPVGGHRDLLAYLVRRLLENGANSSFVSVAADPSVPIDEVLRRPQSWIASPAAARNQKIPLPRDLYQPQRRNSDGVEFGERKSLDALLAEIRAGTVASSEAQPLIDGVALPGIERAVISPIDGRAIGIVRDGDEAIARSAMAAAAAGFPAWAATPCEERAAFIERAAERLEQHRGELLALLQNEAGKTLDDAVAELREAVDYCRYYAAQARACLVAQPMPGPTGESNMLRYRGRGVFVCISPWNFPLAIFLGQVSAALVAGNAVVPSRPNRRRSSPRARSRCCMRPACQKARCISSPATAPSVRASCPTPAPPASSSPARPTSAAPSIKRSPPSAVRSCR
jgi:RHH-type proline utilization regulon transcriptional repressor/proline dehydrogenase/delta 1-pyrroline-5-carboxylate dehydrogenase